MIHTLHDDIRIPTFIPVGTKTSMKTVLPEVMVDLGTQVLLANAYHLYLRPGSGLVDEAGGFGCLMNWPGPTLVDLGGSQMMSLGAGFKKVLAMDTKGLVGDDVIAEGRT